MAPFFMKQTTLTEGLKPFKFTEDVREDTAK